MLQWIEDLGAWYFRPEFAGRQVRLHWPNNAPFSDSKEELLSTVRNWQPSGNIITTALQLERAWHPNDSSLQLNNYGSRTELPCNFPPYLPHLVCFAIAWDVEGDFNWNAYYGRLNQILHLHGDQAIGTAKFRPSEDLWRELSHWANELCGGELGVFSAISAGAFRYVGYPLAQVALSPGERRRLHHLFIRNGLDSDIALEDAEIAALIRSNSEVFSTRIQNATEAQNDFFHIICGEIRAELSSFEPTPEELRQNRAHGGGTSRPTERLRLACRVDLRGVCEWFFTLPSQTNGFRDVVSNNWAIRPGQEAALWHSDEGHESSNPIDFPAFHFLGDIIAIRSARTNYYWPARDVRFFVPSNDDPDVLVERDWLPDIGHFCVLLSADAGEILETLRGSTVSGAIPPDCVFMRLADSEPARQVFPQRLKGPGTLRPVSLFGGLRTYMEDDEYFFFAPPRLAVSSGWELDEATDDFLGDPDGDGFRQVLPPADKPRELRFVAKRTDGITRKVRHLQLCWNPSSDDDSIDESNELIPCGDVADRPCEATEEHIELDCSSDLRHSTQFDASSIYILQVMSQWGSCSYSRFVGAVKHLFGSDPASPRPANVLMNLYLLDHLEIGTSPSNGHWQRVSISPGRLQQLPLKASGDAIATLCGRFDWGQLEQKLRRLPSDSIDWQFIEQSRHGLPPSVRIRGPEPDLRHLASEWSIEWNPWSPSVSVPTVNDAEHYFTSGQWAPGVPMTSNQLTFFSPYRLSDSALSAPQLDRLKLISGRYLFATHTTDWGQHKYLLFDCADDRVRTVPPDHRQWARWLCYVRSAERFYSQLARHQYLQDSDLSPAALFDAHGHRFAVPATLLPPRPLSRMLVRCSGLLPTYHPWSELAPTTPLLAPNTVDDFDTPLFVDSRASAVMFNTVVTDLARSIASCLNLDLFTAQHRA